MDPYLGRDVPQLVLYTDGQLLLKRKQGSWFVQTTLTSADMCTVLLRLERAGFFAVEGDGSRGENDPIYAFGGTPQFSGDGMPHDLIQVNGPRGKLVSIEPGYIPYLIQPVQAALQIVRQYSPEPSMTDFRAQYLVLWITKGRDTVSLVTPQPGPQPWPSQLPTLAGLLNGREEKKVFFEDENVTPLLNLFGNRLSDIMFEEDGQTYYVIARPLLPHEAPDRLSSYPYEPVEFDLPFDCQ